MALQEHERLATGAEHSQGVHDQACADRLTLTIGAYPNGAQHQHVDEPTWSIEERMRVQDLADGRSVDPQPRTTTRRPMPTMTATRRGEPRSTHPRRTQQPQALERVRTHRCAWCAQPCSPGRRDWERHPASPTQIAS